MINWKLRFKNKATVTTLALAVIALVYQILGMFGVVPSISENAVIDIAAAIINLLAIAGILIDPTTEGVSDSARAMGYEEPYKGGKEDEEGA